MVLAPLLRSLHLLAKKLLNPLSNGCIKIMLTTLPDAENALTNTMAVIKKK